MKKEICLNPKCSQAELLPVELESSFAMKKMYCPVCGRQFGRFTTMGKAAQIAPVITASVILSKFLLAIATTLGHHDGDIDIH